MKKFLFLAIVVLCACRSGKDTAGSGGGAGGVFNKKVLSEVIIKTLRLDNYPRYGKDSERWDAYAPFAEDPDIFITLAWNDTHLYKSEVHQECVYGTPVAFYQSIPFKVIPFDKPLVLEVFDEDGISSNDNLGYFSFSLMDYKDWKTVVLKKPDSELSVTMDLEWVYK